MKLVIMIGPDTLGTTRFGSVAAARRSLNKAWGSRHVRSDNVSIYFHGRKYCKAELKDATVQTVGQHFATLSAFANSPG
jgi:hypothetical protein